MSGEDDFAKRMGGVKPLEGRDKLRPDPTPSPLPPSTEPAPTFVVETEGDDTYLRREDVSRRQLAELRAGRISPDLEIDLHGLGAAEAKALTLVRLALAQREGGRCILVIHGAGRHSPDGPVLKTALPGWLREAPLARELLAFATAPRSLGGPGASLVLLRRARAREVS